MKNEIQAQLRNFKKLENKKACKKNKMVKNKGLISNSMK